MEIQITLKAARVNASLKQVDAAKHLGVSIDTIKNYESGKSMPDVQTAKKLADLYNFPLDNIFFGKKSAKSE